MHKQHHDNDKLQHSPVILLWFIYQSTSMLFVLLVFLKNINLKTLIDKSLLSATLLLLCLLFQNPLLAAENKTDNGANRINNSIHLEKTSQVNAEQISTEPEDTKLKTTLTDTPDITEHHIEKSIEQNIENTNSHSSSIEKPTTDDPLNEINNDKVDKDAPVTQNQSTSIETPNRKALNSVDRSQINVSNRLHRFSSSVDRFFADENYVEESQDSRMRLSLTSRFQKHQDTTFQPRINLSLSLPNTKNRMRLRFQSNDEDFGDNQESNIDNSLSDSVTNTTFASALGLILLAQDTVDIRADAGVRLSSTIDPFTRLRLRKSVTLNKVELTLTETLQWRESRGKTSATLFDVDNAFHKDYLFRSRTELIYQDIDSFWSQRQSFTLFDKLSSKSVISYSIGVSGQDEDTLHERKKDQVNDYWIELRYRKVFYQDWLSYEVAPGLSHPREVDFDPSPRIEFRLEALYGNLTQ